jgi:hypothetical protein
MQASAEPPIAPLARHLQLCRMKPWMEEIGAPLVRLVGHAFAAAVGFFALAAISLIPIEVVKVLALLGFSEISRPLEILEQTLLFADACLFAVIFLSATASFAAETFAVARRRIRSALREHRRDR